MDDAPEIYAQHPLPVGQPELGHRPSRTYSGIQADHVGSAVDVVDLSGQLSHRFGI